MNILNWMRCKTLRDLNNDALERTRSDLVYARMSLGRAKMEVELLEARERCLERQADEFGPDLSDLPTINAGLTV